MVNHKILKADRALLDPKGKRNLAVKFYREESTLPEQLSLLSRISEFPRPAQLLIAGRLTASKWSDIASHRPSSIPKKPQRVITWAVATFAANAKKIEEHLQIQRRVETASFQSNWGEAREQLSLHEEKHGRTLWGLQWKLYIIDETEGETERRALVDVVHKESDGNIGGLIAYLLSHRLERTIPTEALRSSIRSVCKSDHAGVEGFLTLATLDELDPTIPVASLFGVLECLPLIDRYVYFMKFATHAMSSGHSEASQIARALARLSQLISDPISKMITDLENPEDVSSSEILSYQYFAAWDSYFNGDYGETIEITHEISTQKYPDLNNVDLRVKASMYSSARFDDNPKTVETTLERILCNINCRGEHMESALNLLDRFSLRVPYLFLSVQTRHLYLSHTNSTGNRARELQACYRSPAHTPRLTENIFDSKKQEKYLQQLSKLGSSICAPFLLDCIEGGTQLSPKIPLSRSLFFSGLYSYKKGEFSEAIENLEKFLTHQRTEASNLMAPYAIEEAKRILISVYEKTENAADAQRLLIEWFQECPQDTRRMPVQRVYGLSKSKRSETSKWIYYPILAHLACTSPHEICMALKNFLRSQTARIPSELINNERFSISASPLIAVLYLRVCIPEVLDSIQELGTQEKVETERLLLLRWISDNAPQLTRAAENEKLRLIQDSQLRMALDKVDESRVVLNFSSLREAEDEKLQFIHARYRSQKELAIAQVSDEIQSAVSKLASGGASQVIFLEPLETKISRAFASSFRKVVDIFLASPHFGLEACLSARVRHGIIIEHLMRPIKSHFLFVTKDAASRNEIVEHWKLSCPSFSATSTEERKAIIEILEALTESFTKISSEVKDHWIQSKTSKNEISGLFDYSYTDSELNAFLNDSSVNDEDPDSFFDQIFLSISSRTRNSLKEIRTKIKNQMRPELGGMIDKAIAEIQVVGNFPGVRGALVNARHSAEIACEEMTGWFKKASGVLMDDASFELICGTAVGMIERLHPEVSGRHAIRVDSPFRIKGRHFTAFVHLLFFLLENGIKYTTSGPNGYNADLCVDATSNLLQIRVTNSMANEQDAEVAVEKIRSKLTEVSVNLDPAKVIKEGGSGFSKIMAAFIYEFAQRQPKITASCEGAKVVLEVTGEIAGIAL